jgi:DUF1009 family protein
VSDAPRIALIAGQGAMPGIVASRLGREGRSWFACHLEGFEPRGVGQSRAFRLEELGSFLAALCEERVGEVVFAGAIRRPRLDPEALDEKTAPLAPRIAEALRAGDDAALRTVLALFEEAGLRVTAPQEVVPELGELPVSGTPGERDRADIARAAEVHAALAQVDVGQGCVVASGQVLAVEALPGTDWMLASLARRPRAPQPRGGGGDMLGGMADWLSGGAPREPTLPEFPRPDGGVFFKAAKAGQDRRIDLPTIGPETVARCAAAGLAGLILERGGVLVIDREQCLARARSAGLFVAAWEPPDAPGDA